MDLRQSTAVIIEFGPFLDKTDGVTLLTGLVSAIDNGSTGIKLSKNGGTLTVRHASVTASSYDSDGCYKVTLDTTDTATLGTLRMIYTDATTCLPVWQDFMILTANAWDSQYATGVLTVNATQLAGQAIAAAAGVTFPTSVASPTNISAGTITTVTNLTNAPTSGDLTATMKASVTAAVPTASANAAAIGARVPSESYAADGAEPTYDQFWYMIWAALAQYAISSTTISAKKLDGTTQAMAFTMDSATVPTSRTRTT